jgi:hypothetical protein
MVPALPPANNTVEIAFDLFTGGAPDNHLNGTTVVMTDGSGGFTAQIQVNLHSIAGANVGAKDVASGKTATASL